MQSASDNVGSATSVKPGDYWEALRRDLFWCNGCLAYHLLYIVMLAFRQRWFSLLDSENWKKKVRIVLTVLREITSRKHTGRPEIQFYIIISFLAKSAMGQAFLRGCMRRVPNVFAKETPL